MKAWVLHDTDDIRYEDVDMPQLRDGEVLVKVMAAGICGSDIPRIYKTGAHNMPLIPGHEFAGRVIAVDNGSNSDYCNSAGDDAGTWLNKRVGIFPLIPCRQCVACRKEMYEMCRNYNYLGSRCNGGFAEYVAVPAANLIKLPDNVSYQDAAMLEPSAVACHAIRRVLGSSNAEAPDNAGNGTQAHTNMQRHNLNIAVCGLGTIGMLIVMLLKSCGYDNIFVIGNKSSQKAMTANLGISEENFYDIREEISRGCDAAEWLMEKTDGSGVDVFFECVGKNETVNWAVKSAACGGSICFVGNPYSDMNFDKQTYWKILRNQLHVTGTWNSSFTGNEDDDWHYVLKSISSGSIMPSKLITHRFRINELESGLRIMRDKSEDYIKIMSVMN